METFESTLAYLSRHSYLGVYGLILMFSFVLPFSKTLVIVGSGILASQGIGSIPGYVLVAIAGLITADGIYYVLGYVGGERVRQWRPFSGAGARERFREAEARFKRHQWLAVFSARFLPFLRTLIFVVAGMSRMSPLRFLQADFLSACVLVTAAILSGYLFSEHHEALVRYVKQGEYIIALLIGVVLVVLLCLPRGGKNKRPAK